MKCTCINPRENITLPIGTKVRCEKATSAIGKEIVKVFDKNGKELGGLTRTNGAKGSGVQILITGTEVLTDDNLAKMPSSWEATVCGAGQINHGMIKDAIAIEFVAPWEKGTAGKVNTQQGDVVIAANVQGASVRNPQKAVVIGKLNQGDTVILNAGIEVEGGEEKIFVYHNNERAGFLAPSSMSDEDCALIMSALKKGENLECKAFGQTTAAYKVKVLIPGSVAAAAAADAAKSANAAEKKRIIDDGIASEELLAKIEDYCLDCGLTPKQVGKIFATYQTYPAEAQLYMITQPKTLYKDVHGYIEEAVCCILAREPLVMSGEAGSGKNCAVETLAWIFQRPLLDVAINAQTDKYDLMGSKTIEVEETDSGVPVQKVAFQIEHLGRAMEWGAMFNTDELNFADQGVTGILHAVADTRRALDIPGYRKIVAAPNFQLLATMNVDYAGTHQLNEALDSRYSEIVFDMPESIIDILERACPDAEKKDIQICDKIYKKILLANADNTMCMQVSARNFISALNKVAQGLSLKRALTMNLANKLRDADYKKAMKELIEMNCPNR